MKVAIIVSKFPVLSETFILNQITGLIERGHEVDIYADEPSDTAKIHPDVEKYHLLDRTYYAGIPANHILRVLKGIGLLITNLHKSPWVLIRSLNAFKYRGQFGLIGLLYAVIPLLRQQSSYDVIHCHFGVNGLKGTFLREIGAIQGKLITTFHGYDVNLFPHQHGTNIYQQLFQQGDLFTSQTTFMMTKLLSLGCPQEKMVKLPMGVDISKYPFQPRVLHPGEPIEVITVARLVEKKGIEYSIRAVAKVLKSYPQIVYRIVGDGPLRESLEQLLVEFELPQVKLLGWMTQDEVCQLYAKAQIFILSSVTAADGDQEGQGLVLQESQAMGLPVLSTLHNGIPDGVLDGKSGFLVPERDVDALAEKLQCLIEHPADWPEMGRAGRAFVEECYDMNKLSDRLVEIYQLITLPCC